MISLNIKTIVAAKHILLINLPILRLNETKVNDWRGEKKHYFMNEISPVYHAVVIKFCCEYDIDSFRKNSSFANISFTYSVTAILYDGCVYDHM